MYELYSNGHRNIFKNPPPLPLSFPKSFRETHNLWSQQTTLLTESKRKYELFFELSRIIDARISVTSNRTYLVVHACYEATDLEQREPLRYRRYDIRRTYEDARDHNGQPSSPIFRRFRPFGSVRDGSSVEEVGEESVSGTAQ